MRSVTSQSIIAGFVVIAIFLLVVQVYPDSLPFVTIGGTQAILTLTLVWYHLSEKPDLDILQINIEPMKIKKDKEKIVAKEGFTKTVRNEDRPVVEGKSTWKWRLLKRGRKVECEKTPSKIKISLDIVNRGGSGTTLHEIRYKGQSSEKIPEEIIPLKEKEPGRKYLKEGERFTEKIIFPKESNRLQEGNLFFNIALYTHKKEKMVLLRIEISENKKTIKWWQWEKSTTSILEWIAQKFE